MTNHFICKGSVAKSLRKGSYIGVGIKDKREVLKIVSVKGYVKFRGLN